MEQIFWIAAAVVWALAHTAACVLEGVQSWRKTGEFGIAVFMFFFPVGWVFSPFSLPELIADECDYRRPKRVAERDWKEYLEYQRYAKLYEHIGWDPGEPCIRYYDSVDVWPPREPESANPFADGSWSPKPLSVNDVAREMARRLDKQFIDVKPDAEFFAKLQAGGEQHPELYVVKDTEEWMKRVDKELEA